MQLYYDGPFVVYSRTSEEKVLNFIQTNVKIDSLDEMKTIFLLGPRHHSSEKNQLLHRGGDIFLNI
jgi:hypothetical protein